jgi:hypothetical protein
MRRLIPVVILTFLLAATCLPVFAEEKDAKDSPWEKVSINLGSFVSSVDSSIRLSANGTGASIDVGEALGMDTSQTVFRTEASWRFTDNRRHRAELSWFALRRDGSKQLGQDITIDGVTYPTGTTVNSGLDLDIYKANYSYSFFHDNRMDIGASLGLYVMPISFELTASGFVNGYVAESVTAPMPVLGLRADFALTPRWFLKSDIDVFYLEYESFKGSLFDTKVALEYNAFKHVGFGLAVESFNVQVESEGEDYPQIDLVGQIQFQYIGAMLYAKFYF